MSWLFGDSLSGDNNQSPGTRFTRAIDTNLDPLYWILGEDSFYNKAKSKSHDWADEVGGFANSALSKVVKPVDEFFAPLDPIQQTSFGKGIHEWVNNKPASTIGLVTGGIAAGGALAGGAAGAGGTSAPLTSALGSAGAPASSTGLIGGGSVGLGTGVSTALPASTGSFTAGSGLGLGATATPLGTGVVNLGGAAGSSGLLGFGATTGGTYVPASAAGQGVLGTGLSAGAEAGYGGALGTSSAADLGVSGGESLLNQQNIQRMQQLMNQSGNGQQGQQGAPPQSYPMLQGIQQPAKKTYQELLAEYGLLNSDTPPLPNYLGATLNGLI